MVRRILIALVFLTAFPAPGRADSFLLKSGEVVRGKLVEKRSEKYFIRVSGQEKLREVPVAQVSIADIDPGSTALPKGTVSLLLGPEESGDEDKPKKEGRSVEVVPANDPLDPEVPHFANSGVLKKAEDTVKLSNDRTAQTIREIEKMKEIADAANAN